MAVQTGQPPLYPVLSVDVQVLRQYPAYGCGTRPYCPMTSPAAITSCPPAIGPRPAAGIRRRLHGEGPSALFPAVQWESIQRVTAAHRAAAACLNAAKDISAEPSALSETARMMTNGMPFTRQAWAMAPPSISQQRPPNLEDMASFCALVEMNWSPVQTRPS